MSESWQAQHLKKNAEAWGESQTWSESLSAGQVITVPWCCILSHGICKWSHTWFMKAHSFPSVSPDAYEVSASSSISSGKASTGDSNSMRGPSWEKAWTMCLAARWMICARHLCVSPESVVGIQVILSTTYLTRQTGAFHSRMGKSKSSSSWAIVLSFDVTLSEVIHLIYLVSGWSDVL